MTRLLFAFFLFASVEALAKDWLGPSDILVAGDSEVLYILERDAAQIRKIGVDGDRKPVLLSLPAEPVRMRLFPDKKHLAVTGGGPLGRLWIIDLDTFSITADIPVGHTPTDVAVSPCPDGQIMLYIGNRFGGDVSVVELAPDFKSGKELRRVPAGREPIALTITPDGKTLVVGNHLPEDSSLNFSISCRVRFIDTKTWQTDSIRLDVGAINLRDVVLTPDGRYACFTGQIGHFQQMPNDVNGGWMNENILFVVDVPGRKAVVSHRLDDFAIGSANPWGVSLSTNERFLLVSASGSCDLMLINLMRFVDMIDGFAGYPKKEKKPELGDRLPMHLRIPVGLKGIRHAVMPNDRIIYATSYFEDSVAKIHCRFSEPFGYVAGSLPQDDLEIPRRQRWNLRPDVTTPGRSNYVRSLESGNRTTVAIFQETETNAPLRFLSQSEFVLAPGIRFQRSFARLGPEPSWTDVRYGEMLFHDATLCKEHWQSCTSCHPEGRTDTLNWDLLNDGQDNPKNSKSMLLSHDTPPSMAHGVRDRAETAVRKGFETILMIPATEEEAAAVDAYLSNLKPVPSPRRVFDRTKNDNIGTLSESAKRGRRIFNSNRGGCSDCHPAPVFTDMRMHDVGTRSLADTGSMFDTPTLIEVWRTAPYLHDGRYTTIRELINEGRHVQANGRFDELTEPELDDLVEYILSL